MAVTPPFPNGAREQALSLMSDHGCQPTALTCMEACSTLGIHQPFPSDHNPQGNADTERFRRTLNEECLGLQDWSCPLPLMNALTHWITYDNEPSLPSALGYVSPRPCEQGDYNRHRSPFDAA
jgi:putative transposase